MIEKRGSRELIARMKKDIEKLKGSITRTHQNLVKTMFIDLVSKTPQWSGELALHWGIEVHGKKAPGAYSVKNPAWQQRERRIPQLQEPFQMGAEPAVTMTIARELPKIAEIRYNSIVKFVNNMPYAEAVESGEGPNGRPIRPENRLATYGGVAMVQYLDTKYGKLGQLKKAIVK